MFGTRSIRVGILGVALGIFAVSTCATANATPPPIRDDGGFFSPGAIQSGNQTISEIFQRTSPQKEVVVQTYASLPTSGGTPQQFAEGIFRQQQIDGLLVLLIKQPRSLFITVGRRTEARFLGKEQMRQAILTQFKRGDFDAGLRDGLTFAASQLVAAFPANGIASRSVRSGSERAGMPALPPAAGLPTSGFSPIKALLIVGGIFLLIRMFTGMGRRPMMGGGYPGGMQGGGYGGGGGWGSSILGGLFGAAAGNFLYDRMFRGGGDAYGSTLGDQNNVDQGSGMFGSDNGDVGSTSGGGWDDSGGGFSGGGSDDSSGGDW